MDTFALTASALPRFSLVVLTGVMAVAFAMRTNKARGAWWFVMMIGAFCVHHAAQVGLYAVYSEAAFAVLVPLTWSSAFVATFASVGFAYWFLGLTYPREARIVISLIGALTLGAVIYVHSTAGQGIGYDDNTPIDIAASLLILFHLVTNVVVLVRRSRDKETPEATRRALRAFGGAVSFALVFPVIILLRETGVISGWLDEQLSLVAWAVVLMAILTSLVNYSPRPTSFLVKVVGFAFVATVTALGVASAVAFREPLAAPGPAPTGIQFVPDGAGGYTLTDADDPIDDARGQPIDLEDGQPARVDLGFDFPFAGSLWREVLVDDDAYVTFGDEAVSGLNEIYRGTPVPWIAPLLLALSPDVGDVTVARDSSRATLTWRDVPLSQASDDPSPPETATVQLSLDASGAVAIRYGRFPSGRVWVR
ncbi:MAG: hypothetical protein AAFQ43_06335, partial [Bacteroidota bacterium]